MELTKLGHSALLITQGDSRILIDPGALVPVGEEDFAVDAILYTHTHFDHFAPDQIPADFSGEIFAPADAAAGLDGRERVTLLDAPRSFTIGHLRIDADPGTHLPVDHELDDADNVSYLVDKTVLVTGDDFPATTAPFVVTGFNGPWQSMPMLLDYLRSTTGTVYGVHDALMSDTGKSIVEYFTGPLGKKLDREIRLLRPAETVHIPTPAATPGKES